MSTKVISNILELINNNVEKPDDISVTTISYNKHKDTFSVYFSYLEMDLLVVQYGLYLPKSNCTIESYDKSKELNEKTFLYVKHQIKVKMIDDALKTNKTYKTNKTNTGDYCNDLLKCFENTSTSKTFMTGKLDDLKEQKNSVIDQLRKSNQSPEVINMLEMCFDGMLNSQEPEGKQKLKQSVNDMMGYLKTNCKDSKFVSDFIMVQERQLNELETQETKRVEKYISSQTDGLIETDKMSTKDKIIIASDVLGKVFFRFPNLNEEHNQRLKSVESTIKSTDVSDKTVDTIFNSMRNCSILSE